MNIYDFWPHNGTYIHFQGRRIPVLSVRNPKHFQIWKFWKFKKITPEELCDFICDSTYVFWIACHGHRFITPYLLPADFANTNTTVWINICYTDFTGRFYLKKYFKMKKIDFINFYRPLIRQIKFTDTDVSWKKCGF